MSSKNSGGYGCLIAPLVIGIAVVLAVFPIALPILAVGGAVFAVVSVIIAFKNEKRKKETKQPQNNNPSQKPPISPASQKQKDNLDWIDRIEEYHAFMDD